MHDQQNERNRYNDHDGCTAQINSKTVTQLPELMPAKHLTTGTYVIRIGLRLDFVFIVSGPLVTWTGP